MTAQTEDLASRLPAGGDQVVGKDDDAVAAAAEEDTTPSELPAPSTERLEKEEPENGNVTNFEHSEKKSEILVPQGVEEEQSSTANDKPRSEEIPTSEENPDGGGSTSNEFATVVAASITSGNEEWKVMLDNLKRTMAATKEADSDSKLGDADFSKDPSTIVGSSSPETASMATSRGGVAAPLVGVSENNDADESKLPSVEWIRKLTESIIAATQTPLACKEPSNANSVIGSSESKSPAVLDATAIAAAVAAIAAASFGSSKAGTDEFSQSALTSLLASGRHASAVTKVLSGKDLLASEGRPPSDNGEGERATSRHDRGSGEGRRKNSFGGSTRYSRDREGKDGQQPASAAGMRTGEKSSSSNRHGSLSVPRAGTIQSLRDFSFGSTKPPGWKPGDGEDFVLYNADGTPILPNKVFIGGLSQAIDSRRLRDYFSPYGQIVDAFVSIDEATRRSRGFGFVTFSDVRSVAAALNSPAPHCLDGRVVECKPAFPRGTQANQQTAAFNAIAKFKGLHPHPAVSQEKAAPFLAGNSEGGMEGGGGGQSSYAKPSFSNREPDAVPHSRGFQDGSNNNNLDGISPLRGSPYVAGGTSLFSGTPAVQTNPNFNPMMLTPFTSGNDDSLVSPATTGPVANASLYFPQNQPPAFHSSPRSGSKSKSTGLLGSRNKGEGQIENPNQMPLGCGPGNAMLGFLNQRDLSSAEQRPRAEAIPPSNNGFFSSSATPQVKPALNANTQIYEHPILRNRTSPNNHDEQQDPAVSELQELLKADYIDADNYCGVQNHRVVEAENLDAGDIYLTGGGRSYLALSGDKWLQDCAEADERKIFVGGLPDVTPAEFAQQFERFGPVGDAMVMFDRRKKRQRGFGFITFATMQGVENSLMRSRHPFKSKSVEVKKAHPLVIQKARMPARAERERMLAEEQAKKEQQMSGAGISFRQSENGRSANQNQNGGLSISRSECIPSSDNDPQKRQFTAGPFTGGGNNNPPCAKRARQEEPNNNSNNGGMFFKAGFEVRSDGPNRQEQHRGQNFGMMEGSNPGDGQQQQAQDGFDQQQRFQVGGMYYPPPQQQQQRMGPFPSQVMGQQQQHPWLPGAGLNSQVQSWPDSTDSGMMYDNEPWNNSVPSPQPMCNRNVRFGEEQIGYAPPPQQIAGTAGFPTNDGQSLMDPFAQTTDATTDPPATALNAPVGSAADAAAANQYRTAPWCTFTAGGKTGTSYGGGRPYSPLLPSSAGLAYPGDPAGGGIHQSYPNGGDTNERQPQGARSHQIHPSATDHVTTFSGGPQQQQQQQQCFGDPRMPTNPRVTRGQNNVECQSVGVGPGNNNNVTNPSSVYGCYPRNDPGRMPQGNMVEGGNNLLGTANRRSPEMMYKPPFQL